MMTPRLTADERRAAILAAALPVFAKHGFAGATTKQIAESAGVSEALLYRHFPSKDELYMAMHEHCCVKSEIFSRFIGELQPSTSTLVHSVYFMMASIFLHKQLQPDSSENDKNFCRLMIGSLLEDGEFARKFLNDQVVPWLNLWRACVDAAIAGGDLRESHASASNKLWFTHHLAVMLALAHMPGPVLPYEMDARGVCDDAVLFCLNGIGLTEKAIATHYNPKAIQLFSEKMFQSLNP